MRNHYISGIITTILFLTILLALVLEGVYETRSTASSTTTTYNVVAMGADPSGQRDVTQVVRNVLTLAEKQPGSVLYFPPGTYLLNDNDGLGKDFQITTQVAIEGAGPNQTKIIEAIGAKSHLKPKTIFQIQADDTTISGLTLDAETYDAATPIMDFANDTTLYNLNIMGPHSSPTYNSGQFGMRVIAICNHSDLDVVHRVGNTIHDINIVGNGSAGDTDIDLSCQKDANAYNINDTGNGMDLYVVQGVNVNNFKHHDSASGQFSIVVTAPSSNIAINNFQTWGQGGKIEASPIGYVSEVSITNEVMHDLSQRFIMGDGTVYFVNSTLGDIKIEADTQATMKFDQTTHGIIACPKPPSHLVLTSGHCS